MTVHDNDVTTDPAAAPLLALARAVARWRAQAGPSYPESQGGAADAVAQQQLYEHWVGRSAWKARAEALPLLVGIDPDDWAAVASHALVAAAEAEVWRQMKADAAAGRLAVGEGDVAPESWRVAPSAVYLWAVSHRHRVPDALELPLRFVMKVVKREPGVAEAAPAVPVPGVATRPGVDPRSSATEQVLGAALNIVSKWPAAVSDRNGFIDAEKVVEHMQRSARVYFGSARLPLARTDAVTLIERWLI